ncbi:MAG: hypothetical protein M5U09_21200 [Gammaproteobacteria bacterium]|nr:hypothetical protein [Gammaproteobacteria bacterium]
MMTDEQCPVCNLIREAAASVMTDSQKRLFAERLREAALRQFQGADALTEYVRRRDDDDRADVLPFNGPGAEE